MSKKKLTKRELAIAAEMEIAKAGKPSKSSVVIVPKIPTDALRNLAKLERRATPGGVSAAEVKRFADMAKTIKTIYEDEGADACLAVCKHFKTTRHDMLLLLAALEAKAN